MKIFRIGVYEEQGGYMNIKARTKKEAEKKAYEHIEKYGINEKVDVTHRNCQLV